MGRKFVRAGLAALAAAGMAACGGGSNGGSGTSPTAPTSYIGTTGVFAAYVDAASGVYASAPIGAYAGKKQSLRGTVDFFSGSQLGQAAGVEVYKASDGHVYGLDLTVAGSPTGVQLSSEYAATVDDTCTLSGTAVAGANYDYVGVNFYADLQTPTRSAYFYRLPGGDGVCDTADDVIHAVRTGMSATDAPLLAPGMPLAAVRNASGGITGYVLKSGASLVLTDTNLANPVTLGSFGATVGVAVALPVGTTQGYPSGQLYVVDGSIYYVDYAGHSISTALYTIPNWSPTSAAALYAASPSTLYFAINIPAAGATPASATIYAMPADGSAVPAPVDSEAGRIATLSFPIQGSALVFGIVDPTYTVKAFALGVASTLATSNGNGGTFVATSSTVYYTTWTSVTDSTAKTVTRSGTSAGIVRLDGSVVQSPLASAAFVSGGEQQPWPADTTTTATPYRTVFLLQGLSTATVTNPANGYAYTEDAIGGASLTAIDTGSNLPGANVGTLPASSAVGLTGTFRGDARVGFLEATSAISTQDPATRDLYVLGATSAGSLARVTNDL